MIESIKAQARKLWSLTIDDVPASALAISVANEADVCFNSYCTDPVVLEEKFAFLVNRAIENFESCEERDVPEPLKTYLLNLIEMCGK